MKNPIKNLQIQNFKSIKDIELDCKRINIFIGKPNVGKSNVLEALSLFSAPYCSTFHFPNDTYKYLSEYIRYDNLSNLFYFQETKNPISVVSNIGIANLRYHKGQVNTFDLVLSGDRSVLKSLDKIDHINAYAHSFRDFVKSYKAPEGTTITPFYMPISPEGRSLDDQTRMSNIVSPVKKYEFKKNIISENKYHFFLMPPYGNNIFTIIETNESVRNAANLFFKEYKLDFVNDVVNHKFILQRRRNDDIFQLPYSLTADTLQRMIFHTAAIESNEESVLLFEEPEAHSFPPYISTLAETIIENKKNQFFIATHSPYLLTPFIEKCDYKDVAIFITTYENHQTKVRELSKKEIDNIMDTGIDLFFNIKAFS